MRICSIFWDEEQAPPIPQIDKTPEYKTTKVYNKCRDAGGASPAPAVANVKKGRGKKGIYLPFVQETEM